MKRKRKRTTKSGKPQFHTAFGFNLSLTGWTRNGLCIVSRETLRQRLMEGWDIEDALTAPLDHEQHGESGTRLHGIWCGMRARCNTPTSTGYDRYGERGIKVCSEWDSYTVFRDWALANGYEAELTIDRIDSKGNYFPSNCRWVTVAENSSRSVLDRATKHTAFGEAKTVREWFADDRNKCKTFAGFNDRIKEGWPIEDAIALEKRVVGERHTAWGESKTWSQWQEDDRWKCGSLRALRQRLEAGWSIEEAISISPQAKNQFTVGDNDG